MAPSTVSKQSASQVYVSLQQHYVPHFETYTRLLLICIALVLFLRSYLSSILIYTTCDRINENYSLLLEIGHPGLQGLKEAQYECGPDA